MVFHILQAVAVLISLLGVINLINTTLSNQASRRLETGALRCVGLTKKQRYRMFVCEGMCYTVWSALLTVGAGLPILADVHYKLSGIVYGMQLPILFLFYIWHCMWRFCSGCNSCYRHGQYEDRRNRPS